MTPPRAPSYYKIKLVHVDASSSLGGQQVQVQLTVGEDSSVHLTPNHNRGMQLASPIVSLGNVSPLAIGSSASPGPRPYFRASLIVEHEAVEHKLDAMEVSKPRSQGQGWTMVNNDGQIVITMPPFSPPCVANSQVPDMESLSPARVSWPTRRSRTVLASSKRRPVSMVLAALVILGMTRTCLCRRG